jgi:FKBP-type peptidyl-prolyl cis-trans isomerase SlyD
MEITKDKVVSLTYELRVNSNDGEIIETVDRTSPLTFLYGTGSLLPKFEDYLSGLRAGDSFDFDLSSEDAYGAFDETSVIQIPLSAFEIEGKVDHELLKVGNKIPMQDGEGHRLNGIVKSVGTDSVTMDFNHPLAGNHLFFKGEVTDIRQATDDELTHGHAHYEGSCEGCDHCGGEGGHCH